MKMTIDPSNTEDLDSAETVLAALRFAQGGGDPDGLLAAAGKQSLTAVIQQIANPNRYGENRLGYLRLVANAGSQGIAVSDLLEQHFGGSYNGFGGTHSSIERSWKALGGPQWAPELIATTTEDRQVVYAPAVPLILDLVGTASPS